MTVSLPISQRALPQRFVLDGVDWDFYETILRQVGDRHVFVTYDEGTLELMSPSYQHDRSAELFGALVRILAEELRVPLISAGSTTLKQKLLRRGLEPDRCFYLGNVPAIRGKRKLDLSRDPPPDLAIEIEISRRLVSRIEIYEALKVPELWRYDGKRLRILVLNAAGKYEQRERSLAFPQVPPSQIHAFIQMAWEIDETAWSGSVRQWLRERAPTV